MKFLKLYLREISQILSFLKSFLKTGYLSVFDVIINIDNIIILNGLKSSKYKVKLRLINKVKK